MGKIKLFFKKGYFSDKIILWMSVAALVINLVNWAILAIFVRDVDFQIILHYNVYFGVDQTGDWKLSFFLPAIGLVLFVANFIVALFKGKKAEQNPWGGVTLEWQVPTPPPLENFETIPTVDKRPYVFNPEVSR